jgi:curved DNA-binding protein CbpA
MTTFYDILGVSPKATADDIRRAFRQTAKRLHPDIADGTETLMRELNEAYETLRDPDRREAYDEALKPKAYRLPRRPPPGGTDGIDPFAFKARIFQPLDQKLRPVLQRLDLAIAELAYDVFDDAYIARFADAVEAAASALDEAHHRLFSAQWPSPLASALNLYRQGLRQAGGRPGPVADGRGTPRRSPGRPRPDLAPPSHPSSAIMPTCHLHSTSPPIPSPRPWNALSLPKWGPSTT